MGNFFEIAFTPEVKAMQTKHGSRNGYARAAAARGEDVELGPEERAFLERRDGIFLSTVTSGGWPYIQFRGGPPGFVHVIDPRTVAFADVRGNKQYVSVGNIATNDRVAVMALDFARQERLKLFAHATIVEPAERPELLETVSDPRTDGVVERIIALTVAGYDWNCPQHITPRFSLEEFRAMEGR